MGNIEEVANRLKGLREALGLSVEELCSACNIDPDTYRKYEAGTLDITVNASVRIAKACGVDITTLLFGEEPKMKNYFVTRKGCGKSVERLNWYQYQSLAAGFSHRKADPFLVTVHPKPEDEPMFLNTHPGQEFNFVVLGRLLLSINGKEVILEPGDSIYFNSELPHGMKALDGEKVCFLAVIM